MRDNSNINMYTDKKREKRNNEQRLAVILNNASREYTELKRIFSDKYQESGKKCFGYEDGCSIGNNKFCMISDNGSAQQPINPSTEHLTIDFAFPLTMNNEPWLQDRTQGGAWVALRALVQKLVKGKNLKSLTVRMVAPERCLDDPSDGNLHKHLNELTRQLGIPVYLQTLKKGFALGPGQYNHYNGTTEYLMIPCDKSNPLISGNKYFDDWVAKTVDKDKYYDYYVYQNGQEHQINHSQYKERFGKSYKNNNTALYTPNYSGQYFGYNY